jgi:hypothetical protein
MAVEVWLVLILLLNLFPFVLNCPEYQYCIYMRLVAGFGATDLSFSIFFLSLSLSVFFSMAAKGKVESIVSLLV